MTCNKILQKQVTVNPCLHVQHFLCFLYEAHKSSTVIDEKVSHPTVVKGKSQKQLLVRFINGNGFPKLLALVCVRIKVDRSYNLSCSSRQKQMPFTCMHDTYPFYKQIHHICFYKIDKINQKIYKINFRSQVKTETKAMISSQTKLPMNFTTAIDYTSLFSHCYVLCCWFLSFCQAAGLCLT